MGNVRLSISILASVLLLGGTYYYFFFISFILRFSLAWVRFR